VVVERKHLKLGLIMPFAMLALATIGFIGYLFLPIERGNLMLFLTWFVGLLFAVGGLFVAVPLTMTTIDIFQSKKLTNKKKTLWFIMLWFIPGGIFAAIYYFFKKKD
jgi:hypothetical protein